MKAKFDAANLNLNKAKINIAYYNNIMAKELRAPYDAIIANNLYKWAKE